MQMDLHQKIYITRRLIMDMNTISNVAATTTTYATSKENVKAKADNAKVTDTGVV